MTDPVERARLHPEVQRMQRDRRYNTDAAYRLSAEQLRQFLGALYQALTDEEVDDALQTRLVNRVVYGNAHGIPLDALAVLQKSSRGYRFRSPETDGLGPLMPGDVVRETIPVRIEGPMPDDLREKITGALGGLTEGKQARWLAEGGEERHHTGGPPPNAADATFESIREGIEDAAALHTEPEHSPRWQRALRRLRGGDGNAATSEPEGS